MANKPMSKKIAEAETDVPSDFAGMFAKEWAKSGGKTKSYKDKDGSKVVEIVNTPKKKK